MCNNNGHQIVQCGFLDLSMQLCFKNDGFHGVVLREEKRGTIQYLHVLWCVISWSARSYKCMCFLNKRNDIYIYLDLHWFEIAFTQFYT